MANIRRKRPRPSKNQSMASNSAIDTCIMELAASVKATIPVAATPIQTETDITDRTEMDAKRNSIADAIWQDASSKAWVSSSYVMLLVFFGLK